MDRATQIPHLLKEASKCGISDDELDNELVLNPLSITTTTTTITTTTTSADRESPVASTSTVDEADVDDDDLEEISADDAHREEEGAMDRAANMLECIIMTQKKCHCAYKLYNGQPCISQFSDENQESIWYALFNYYKTCP